MNREIIEDIIEAVLESAHIVGLPTTISGNFNIFIDLEPKIKEDIVKTFLENPINNLGLPMIRKEKVLLSNKGGVV